MTWTAPDNNGLAITEYLVEIKQNDGTFSTQLTYCDGSKPYIRDALPKPTCTIPLTTLYADPYNLPLGAKIEVRVTAKNPYGDSDVSDVGSSNAIIQYVPDAPVSLETNAIQTSATSIGIKWSDG